MDGTEEVFVFDTSAFINGWNDHYPRPALDGLWEFMERENAAGRILIPRAVVNETARGGDTLHEWIKARDHTQPSEAAMARVGQLEEQFDFGKPNRNEADPWVIAEAESRGFAVVTYEGRAFSGGPQAGRRRDQPMPGICQQLGVHCVNPGTALGELGLRL